MKCGQKVKNAISGFGEVIAINKLDREPIKVIFQGGECREFTGRETDPKEKIVACEG